MRYTIMEFARKRAEREAVCMDVHVGDVILTKKPHPCGESAFRVLRVGADFRIRCEKCGREVMVARSKIEKNIRKIVRDGQTL